MSEQETRMEIMCSHCRKKPYRRIWSGISGFKYCSLECNAIENYKGYCAMACLFGVVFPIEAYGLFLVITGAIPLPLDLFAWMQLLLFLLGFPYFGYLGIIGYRGARREQVRVE